MSSQENSLWIKMILLITKWRRFLIINITAFTIIALVISLLQPKWYRAEARILTSSSDDYGALGLSGLVSDLPFNGLGLLPKSDETLRYLAILNSRTLMMNIIDKYNLQERYKTENWEKTIKNLVVNTSFETNIDETISIYAWDKEPEFAAQLANSFVEMLDSLNIVLKAEKAKNNRIFLQARLEENKQELMQAEQNLKNFQEKSGIIEVTEQTKVAIQTIGEIEAQILLKRTELSFKNSFLAQNHNDIQNLKIEINALKKSLHEVQYGSHTSTSSPSEPSFLIAGKDVPKLSMNYFRALRDVEVQNIIYKILTQQFEQARILEVKQTPTIQVLDRAIPPIHKDRPKRALIVLAALFFSSVISVFFILTIEKWKKIKENFYQ